MNKTGIVYIVRYKFKGQSNKQWKSEAIFGDYARACSYKTSREEATNLKRIYGIVERTMPKTTQGALDGREPYYTTKAGAEAEDLRREIEALLTRLKNTSHLKNTYSLYSRDEIIARALLEVLEKVDARDSLRFLFEQEDSRKEDVTDARQHARQHVNPSKRCVEVFAETNVEAPLTAEDIGEVPDGFDENDLRESWDIPF